MPPGHPSFADATTLVWARAWRTAADYAAHRASIVSAGFCSVAPGRKRACGSKKTT